MSRKRCAGCLARLARLCSIRARRELAPHGLFGLAASVPDSGARVLLADDNADLRSYIARLLTERGYEVTPAADGEAALDAIRRRRPDLVVTDVMMPRLDGFGLLRAIREDPALRDLPVVVLSARAGEEAKVEGLEAGADDYLAKPFSARELLARVAANIALARLRREAAEAVRSSEAVAREQAERVQLALDAGAIIGTWVWDIPNDRLIADERFARSFSLSPEECRAGLPLAKVMESIHEEDQPAVARSIADALQSGGAYRCEYRVRQQDGGYRWVEANGRVDLGPDGAPIRFPGILIDVDHRRAIETALREMNEDLERRVQSAIAERETRGRGTAPGAKNGSPGTAHRRHCARLQQPPDHRYRQCRHGPPRAHE